MHIFNYNLHILNILLKKNPLYWLKFLNLTKFDLDSNLFSKLSRNIFFGLLESSIFIFFLFLFSLSLHFLTNKADLLVNLFILIM